MLNEAAAEYDWSVKQKQQSKFYKTLKTIKQIQEKFQLE